MKITLEQNEIEDAIKAYVGTQINLAPGQDIDIDFNAGRGPNGLSANLNIQTAGMKKSSVTTFRDQPGLRTPVDVKTPASQKVGRGISDTPDAREEAPETLPSEDADPVEETGVDETVEETAPADEGNTSDQSDAEPAAEKEDEPAAKPKSSRPSIFSPAKKAG